MTNKRLALMSKQVMNEMDAQKMEKVVAYYLSGYLESQIADLLDITVFEVKNILSDSTLLKKIFDDSLCQKVLIQKKQNETILKQTIYTEFRNMTGEDVKRVIHDFIGSNQNMSAYCDQYDIPEFLFQTYLFDRTFLENKLGCEAAKKMLLKLLNYTQEAIALEDENNHEYINEKVMFQRLLPFYLDSLYTKREFIKTVHITSKLFEHMFENKEFVMNVADETVYQKIQTHQKFVTKLRKVKLPEQ